MKVQSHVLKKQARLYDIMKVQSHVLKKQSRLYDINRYLYSFFLYIHVCKWKKTLDFLKGGVNL